MTFKLIQINIWHGIFFDTLVEFLKKEQPDIITMQEVSSGKVNFWTEQINIFEYLKTALGMQGEYAPLYRLSNDKESSEGNVILTRGKIIRAHAAWLKEYREYDEMPWVNEGPTMPRNVLDLEVEMQGAKFHILATHGAWSQEAIDTSEKIRQARLLADYLRELGNEPFVLGGDFNMESGSEVINAIDHVARNALADTSITNTLNLRTHRAAANLGKGKLVDFIYTSPQFRIESIDVPDVDVSDHLPVRAVLSLH